ncbi:helix-turn-helix transcriptional regulator [Microvirga sp. SRT01]|jgi:DNA-binding HxlR family transcriptional regulator|uniref:Helix-turn-helix transcriptional regulator n=1 Tax=Sphingomonas longa TaxID=2778730 RepID=A0ABS2DA26_9SPHN|nr:MULTISPECIES: helix-turn-helix domain-containing protein [Alphaproteobacteria]MBM6577780.1 helix-turn-helix transcriptional regulator [Sphingomonas sp. BT552]MBR7710822.1 helix-turn-helix transcriptional regulator [Microvirga sp. SRT01]
MSEAVHPTTVEPTPIAPRFTCGLDATLKIISGKWKPLILYFLLRGPTRYGELKRAVRDVSDKVLIQHLKELEADGVLRRNDYKEVPPRVDYTLTPLGQSLAQALEPLCTWGTDNMVEMQKIFAERDSWLREKHA